MNYTALTHFSTITRANVRVVGLSSGERKGYETCSQLGGCTKLEEAPAVVCKPKRDKIVGP